MVSFSDFFEREWVNRDPYFSIHQSRFFHSWELLAASDWNDREVLDIGGIGPISDYLTRFGGARSSLTTTDLRYPIPFSADGFDLVICTEVIEHIKDRDSQVIEDLEIFNGSGARFLLSEIHRVLKPGGQLLLTTPNACSMATLFKWVKRQPPLFDPAHVREYTVAEIDTMLISAGFRREDLVTLNSWVSIETAEASALRAILEAQSFDLTGREDNIYALYVK
jgi:SAM-dependent methyltransferase